MDNLAQDLSAYGYEPAQSEGFRIDTEEGLTWAFRKLRQVRRDMADVDALAENEVQRITEWKQGRLEDLSRSDEYFSSLIGDYYRRLLEENPKAKCSTPYGSASKRTATKWAYGDEGKLVETLQEASPELVRTKYELDKTALKKAATVLDDGRVALDGELLDGVTATKETTITIKTEG